MSYINTSDLIRKCDNEELHTLVQYITKASTNWLEIEDSYKKHYPNHKEYANEILYHIRRFGGNSFRNVFRDGGPDYREIVSDVAKKVGIKNRSDLSIIQLEEKIIEKILRDSINNASASERKEIEAALAEAGVSAKDLSILLSGGSLAAIIGARMAGFTFYKLSLIVANSVAKQVVGHGLKLATNAALSRSIGVLTGPVGWVITGLWTAIDLSGPAYRVTIPCVIHIAMLRRKHMHAAATEGLKEGFVDA